MKQKMRLKIELTCQECDGKGTVKAKPSSVIDTMKCSECDGTGFVQKYIEFSLEGIK